MMKKVLDVIEFIKFAMMFTGIVILGGCGILIVSGAIDAAIKSGLQYLCWYMLLATVCCTVETIVKSIKKIKEKKEDEEE